MQSSKWISPFVDGKNPKPSPNYLQSPPKVGCQEYVLPAWVAPKQPVHNQNGWAGDGSLFPQAAPLPAAPSLRPPLVRNCSAVVLGADLGVVSCAIGPFDLDPVDEDDSDDLDDETVDLPPDSNASWQWRQEVLKSGPLDPSRPLPRRVA